MNLVTLNSFKEELIKESSIGTKLYKTLASKALPGKKKKKGSLLKKFFVGDSPTTAFKLLKENITNPKKSLKDTYKHFRKKPVDAAMAAGFGAATAPGMIMGEEVKDPKEKRKQWLRWAGLNAVGLPFFTKGWGATGGLLGAMILERAGTGAGELTEKAIRAVEKTKKKSK